MTLENVEGCFESLVGVVPTDTATLVELVEANAALVVSNTTLKASNSKPSKVLAKST